jgi:SAM-dependent methyltransferase
MGWRCQQRILTSWQRDPPTTSTQKLGGVMPDSAPQLYGSASSIARLLTAENTVRGQYGAEGSEIYHNLTRHDTAEAAAMLQAAEGCPGPVLELACGSGRLTFPFLQKGYDMLGLDSSPSMLKLLAGRLEEEKERGNDYTDRITTIEGDMANFSLGRRFGIIALGANAVAYLDEAQRSSLFRSAHDHLHDDGIFLMTVIEFPGVTEESASFETIILAPSPPDAATPALLTIMDYVDPRAKIRSTNILRQKVDKGIVVDSAIFAAPSNLILSAGLDRQIESSGLRLTGRIEIANAFRIQAFFAVRPRIMLLTMTRA